MEKSNNSTFIIVIYEISKFRNIGRSTFGRSKLFQMLIPTHQHYVFFYVVAEANSFRYSLKKNRNFDLTLSLSLSPYFIFRNTLESFNLNVACSVDTQSCKLPPHNTFRSLSNFSALPRITYNIYPYIYDITILHCQRAYVICTRDSFARESKYDVSLEERTSKPSIDVYSYSCA